MHFCTSDVSPSKHRAGTPLRFCRMVICQAIVICDDGTELRILGEVDEIYGDPEVGLKCEKKQKGGEE